IGAGREVSQSELQPGDLIFPSDHHVQMYIGNGQVIHAPHTGDVVRIAPLGTVMKAIRIVN
ncbi:MAG TPA: NlpC/P60 family protein, partial [Clostridium sp.]